MTELKFTKAGLVALRINEDGVLVPDTSPILTRLRDVCLIDEGVTLGDIFAAVEAHPVLVEFISQYSLCRWIQEFHEQAKLPRPEGDNEDPLVRLEITANVEFQDHKGINQWYGSWLNFGGIGESGLHYSVGCSPMNTIAHLPVVLNSKSTVRKNYKPLADPFDFEFNFTLLDILDAIYWDISFYGGPRDNEDLHSFLKEAIDEIQAGHIPLPAPDEIL